MKKSFSVNGEKPKENGDNMEEKNRENVRKRPVVFVSSTCYDLS